MAIELYWDNDERTILLVEVNGSYSWEELYDTLDKIKKVTDRTPYTIGAILDVSHGATVPGGTIFTQTALNHAKNMLKMGANGTGPVVICGANNFIRMVFNTFYNLDRKALGNVSFADTLDEARVILGRKLMHTVTSPTPA